jgi:hypothetical protein
MWEIIKDFASWVGWFPVTIGTILVMLLGKYFFDREVSFKDLQINKLKDDVENSKQFQVDLMVQKLIQRTQTLTKMLEDLNSEKESEQREKKMIEHEKETVLKELESARSDVLTLREQLKSYENDLDDLIDDQDYCDICDPDEDHMFSNMIDWYGNYGYSTTGDETLIEKLGCCMYCNSPQIKCQVCGSVTSIDLDREEENECSGGCGNLYTLISYVEDKSLQYKIRVSRMPSDIDK